MFANLRRTVRGGRLIKTSRGVLSTAAVLGAVGAFVPAAFADAVEPVVCLPGSSGTNPASSQTSGGELCDLGVIPAFGKSSEAVAVSADGTAVIGVSNNGSYDRAFRWVDGVLSSLGQLAGDTRGVSTPTAVSLDGAVVVGYALTGEVFRAFRWADGVMEDLGTLATDLDGASRALAVSADGAVVVGYSQTDTVERAFRWAGGVMTDLGSFAKGGKSGATAVSADGTVVVGYAEVDAGYDRAFRWADDRMVNLGTLSTADNSSSTAIAVSADGTVVAGNTSVESGDSHAFRWVDGTMTDLGTLRTNNRGESVARALSADGSTVVGGATTDDVLPRAFRWVDGVMQDLGALPGGRYSQAKAVSADGTVVVGYSNAEAGPMRAFRWADGTMQDLGTLRTNNSGRSDATGVSADGNVVVGYADTNSGVRHAFIWRTQMQDLGNLMLSFQALAAQTDVAIDRQQRTLTLALETACQAGAGDTCLSIGGDLARASASDADGTRNAGTLTLSYGQGITEQATLGGAIAVGRTADAASGIDRGTDVSASLWADFSQGGARRDGWQASAALGISGADATITRGLGLDAVMAASGDARLETWGAQASLGYGVLHRDWLITPSATFARFRSSRSAYDETGADFNSGYDRLSTDRTTLAIAVRGERSVSATGTLSLGLQVERDLTAETTVLTGVTTVPGLDGANMASGLERKRVRGSVEVGYSQKLGTNATLTGSFRVQQAAFGSTPQAGLGITYGIRF